MRCWFSITCFNFSIFFSKYYFYLSANIKGNAKLFQHTACRFSSVWFIISFHNNFDLWSTNTLGMVQRNNISCDTSDHVSAQYLYHRRIQFYVFICTAICKLMYFLNLQFRFRSYWSRRICVCNVDGNHWTICRRLVSASKIKKY